MSVLQALEGYYRRLDDFEKVTPVGWSVEPVGFFIDLDRNGVVVSVEPWIDPERKKFTPKLEAVPKWFGRQGTGSTPFFLWDNTAYALGVTNKAGDKVSRDHEAFRTLHNDLLLGANDGGLTALRKFIEGWKPAQFVEPLFKPEYVDRNVVFRLHPELRFIHQRPAAKAIVEKLIAPTEDGEKITCLVTGELASRAKLHPKIKNISGAAAAEVPLVSFNKKASESHGKEQGDNAPTGEGAAFRYGAALNHLLTRGGPNRLRHGVGDATVVFWADASDAKAAEAADDFFAMMAEPPTDDAEAVVIRDQLKLIAEGRPVSELRADIEEGTRFHVLGLAPNAARLSVRFWQSDDFGTFARRLAQHHRDLAMEPPPYGWGAGPSVSWLLMQTTALQRKAENVPPTLAGEVMRAVLTGSRYPLSLLSAALIRLRAGDPKASDGKALPIGWHAAAIRAVLVRHQRRNPEIPEEGETPMSLKKDHPNAGYQLGRLFAVYELAQRAALGKVNASIRDRYFGAASATPASVFPLIVRGGQNHLAKVRKDKAGWAALIERELEEINSRFTPTDAGIWPKSLRLQDQGEFAIGYYHQRAAKLGGEDADLNETLENEEAEA